MKPIFNPSTIGVVRGRTVCVITLLFFTLVASGHADDQATVLSVEPQATWANAALVECGTPGNMTVVIQNTGDTTWNTAYGLVAVGADDPFSVESGLPLLLSAPVAPGESTTFEIPLSFPTGYQESGTPEWRMVNDTGSGFGDTASRLFFSRCQLDGTNDAHLISHSFPSSMMCGQVQPVRVTMENSGTTTWSLDYLMRLGDVGNDDPFALRTRVDVTPGLEIPPGESFDFDFDLKAPSEAGIYTTEWKMVHEWVGFFGQAASQDIVVSCQPPNPSACSLEINQDGNVTEPGLWWQEDGPYNDCEAIWWTLWSEISPQELETAWRSSAANQSRYQDAHPDETLSSSELDAIKLFVSGAETPQLIPMWEAFVAFAHEASRPGNHRPTYPKKLKDKLTDQHRRMIADLARSLVEEAEIAATEQRIYLDELHSVSRRAFTKLTAAVFLTASDLGDVLTLATAGGVEEEHLYELLETASRNVELEAAVTRLETIRAVLPAAEWRELQQFLLQNFAPQIHLSQVDQVDDESSPALLLDDLPSYCPTIGLESPMIRIQVDLPIFTRFNPLDPNREGWSFRHKATWEGPVTMLGCHSRITVGCRLNYEGDPSRGGRSITDHAPPFSYKDVEGNNGTGYLITEKGSGGECWGVTGTVPRCQEGSNEGVRYNAWLSAVVQGSTGGHVWRKSSPDYGGVTNCRSLFDIHGPVNGLQQGQQVRIQARVKNPDQDEQVFNRTVTAYTGATYRFEGIAAEGATVNMSIPDDPYTTAECHFPEGLNLLVGPSGLPPVPLECCPNEGGCDPILVGAGASGLDEGEHVIVSLNVGGNSLVKRIDGNTNFHQLSTQYFAQGTPFTVASTEPSNQLKTCVADTQSGQLGSANIGFSFFKMFEVSCACQGGVPSCTNPLNGPEEEAIEGKKEAYQVYFIYPPQPFDWFGIFAELFGTDEPDCRWIPQPPAPTTTEIFCTDPQDPDTCQVTEVITVTDRRECSSNKTTGADKEIFSGPKVEARFTMKVLDGGAQRLAVTATATDSQFGINGFLAFVDQEYHNHVKTGGGPVGAHSFVLDLDSLTPGWHLLDLWAMNDDAKGQQPTLLQKWFEVLPEENLPIRDNAAVVSTLMPSNMVCGKQTAASATLRNTGTTVWRKYGLLDGYKLGWSAVEGADPFDAPFRIPLPSNVRIDPGDDYTFHWTMRAPLTPGTYESSLRMIHEGKRWFGLRVRKTVQVTCTEAPILADADGWVRQDLPNTADGGGDALRVRGFASDMGAHAFLAFTVPSTGGEITGGHLRIRTQNVAIPVVGFYSLDDFVLNESTLTWNNWQDGGATYLFLRNRSDLQSDTWHEVDVSEAVAGAQPGDTVYLGLASVLDIAEMDFWSRDSAFPPTLILSIDGP